MITGYNTDVRHGDVVFHVQTEDKGRDNPTIESLVYVGGQVIAARRAGYGELIGDGREDDEVLARMEKQHRTMIAAIRHGKFDQRVAELSLSGRAASEPLPQEGGPADAAGRARAPITAGPLPAPSPTGPARPPSSAEGERVRSPAAAGAPRPAAPASAPRPAPSPDRASDNGDRTLDMVILDYLASEAEQEQLLLTLEEGRDLAVGRRGRLVVRATSSRGGEPVGGAEVGVRLISTVAEPRSLARGTTGPDGAVRLEFDIPALGRGTAALILTAVHGIGRAELKQLL